jgi:hypothetical protein
LEADDVTKKALSEADQATRDLLRDPKTPAWVREAHDRGELRCQVENIPLDNDTEFEIAAARAFNQFEARITPDERAEHPIDQDPLFDFLLTLCIMKTARDKGLDPDDAMNLTSLSFVAANAKVPNLIEHIRAMGLRIIARAKLLKREVTN